MFRLVQFVIVVDNLDINNMVVAVVVVDVFAAVYGRNGWMWFK